MKFYENQQANALYRHYIEAVVTRTNSVTGVRYTQDATIMAWQLANEPRPGYNASSGNHVLPAFYRWVDETAALIKSLDPHHLVSSGNEGLMGCADHDPCFTEAHRTPHIDYLTFHMWPKNWGWLEDDDMAGSIERTLDNAADYVDRHVAYAKELQKPIVLEEFGLPRDGASQTPGSPTTYRDRFCKYVFERIEASVEAGGPFIGSNVWTWGGFGRAAHPDREWRDGDTSYTGDPPQEPQGLNSIFDVDASTLGLLSAHAAKLRERQGAPRP
jgi:mannan endo-1,4-beta-mannosidase